MASAKATKLITFTAQAHENHTSMKIRNVLKWLKSGHDVDVKISSGSKGRTAVELIYKQLQNDVKSGAKFTNMVSQQNMITVSLNPTKDAANLVIEESRVKPTAEEKSFDSLDNQDIFSDEFDAELEKSIKNEMSKHKKK